MRAHAWWNGVFSVIDVLVLVTLIKSIWRHDVNSIVSFFVFLGIGLIFWFATFLEIWDKQ